MNKSSQNIKIDDATFFIKDNIYETCKKPGKNISNVGNIIVLPKHPIYVNAHSEKYINYETSIKTNIYFPKNVEGKLEYSLDSQPQTDLVTENENNNAILSELNLWECGSNRIIPPQPINGDTSLIWYIKYAKELLTDCPENFNALKTLGDIYYKEKEQADANWIKLALKNFSLSAYHLKNNVGNSFKSDELGLLEIYWKLANLYEYAGMYDQAISYFSLLKKYSPQYIEQREKELSTQNTMVTQADKKINYPEETFAHITLCRYLMKNRTTKIAAQIEKDTVLSSAKIEKTDFSDQAIQQRAGLEPIRKMLIEDLNAEKATSKELSNRGRILSIALLGLSKQLLNKSLNVQSVNEFIIGAFNSLVLLFEKEKTNSTLKENLVKDLSSLKSSISAQTAKSDFYKLNQYTNEDCNSISLKLLSNKDKRLQLFNLYRLNCECQNANVYFFIAEYYQKNKEQSEKNWMALSLFYYKKALALDSNFVDARWKIANILEAFHSFELANYHFQVLTKLPEKLKRGYNPYRIYDNSSNTLNFAEEATAHSIVCRYLLKSF